jgi:hypothetical protein
MHFPKCAPPLGDQKCWECAIVSWVENQAPAFSAGAVDRHNLVDEWSRQVRSELGMSGHGAQ